MKYHHELPKHPTAGYTLAAFTDADGRTEHAAWQRSLSWHCACAAPQYDSFAKGGITFTEFCCACGKPSEATLSEVEDAAAATEKRCPDGYEVLDMQTDSLSPWVQYRGPDGSRVCHRPGDPPHRGDFAMAAHAEYLFVRNGRSVPRSELGGQRATGEEIQRAMKAAFDAYPMLKGCHFAVTPEDSEHSRQVTVITDDGHVLGVFPVPDGTFAALQKAAHLEAKVTNDALERRMVPTTCPACEGHLSLCSECGGKGWLPRYKARGIRLEQAEAKHGRSVLGHGDAPYVTKHENGVEVRDDKDGDLACHPPAWAVGVAGMLPPTTRTIVIYGEATGIEALDLAFKRRREQYPGFAADGCDRIYDPDSVPRLLREPMAQWAPRDGSFDRADAVLVVATDRVAIMKNRAGSCRVISRSDDPHFMGADDDVTIPAGTRSTKPPEGYTFRYEELGGGVWVDARGWSGYYYGPHEEYDRGPERNADPKRCLGHEDARQWCASMIGVTAPPLRGMA